MFTDPGIASLGLHRLQKTGLIRWRDGGPHTTPAGDDLLDDDF